MKKNKKIDYVLKIFLALNLIFGVQEVRAQCPSGTSYCSPCGSCVEPGSGCPPTLTRFTETETKTVYVLPAETYFACHVDENSPPETSSTPKTYKAPVAHFRCSNVPTKETTLTMKPYEAKTGTVHRLPATLHYQCETGASLLRTGSCYGMELYKCSK